MTTGVAPRDRNSIVYGPPAGIPLTVPVHVAPWAVATGFQLQPLDWLATRQKASFDRFSCEALRNATDSDISRILRVSLQHLRIRQARTEPKLGCIYGATAEQKKR